MFGAKAQRSPFEVSKSATLLVVDPDKGLRQSMENLLREFKLNLTLSETSVRDLEPSILDSAPDVVLLNLTAPEVCLDLLRDMRQQWPDNKVIVVSESDDIHLYAEAIQLGAYDFLLKPLEIEEFGTTLQRAIEPRRTPCCFAGRAS